MLSCGDVHLWYHVGMCIYAIMLWRAYSIVSRWDFLMHCRCDLYPCKEYSSIYFFWGSEYVEITFDLFYSSGPYEHLIYVYGI